MRQTSLATQGTRLILRFSRAYGVLSWRWPPPRMRMLEAGPGPSAAQSLGQRQLTDGVVDGHRGPARQGDAYRVRHRGDAQRSFALLPWDLKQRGVRPSCDLNTCDPGLVTPSYHHSHTNAMPLLIFVKNDLGLNSFICALTLPTCKAGQLLLVRQLTKYNECLVR
jgi:hypothetical protein